MPFFLESWWIHQLVTTELSLLWFLWHHRPLNTRDICSPWSIYVLAPWPQWQGCQQFSTVQLVVFQELMQKFKHSPISPPIIFISPLKCLQPPLPGMSHLHQRPAVAWFAPPILNIISCLASCIRCPQYHQMYPLPSQLPTIFVLNSISKISSAAFQWIDSSIPFSVCILQNFVFLLLLFLSVPFPPSDIIYHSPNPYFTYLCSSMLNTSAKSLTLAD